MQNSQNIKEKQLMIYFIDDLNEEDQTYNYWIETPPDKAGIATDYRVTIGLTENSCVAKNADEMGTAGPPSH